MTVIACVTASRLCVRTVLCSSAFAEKLEVLQAWEKVLQDIVAGKVTDTAKVMPLEARGVTDQQLRQRG